MELESYIQRIDDCPDCLVKDDSGRDVSLLTFELGIYDNFEFFMGTEKEKLEGFLRKNNYTWHDNSIDDRRIMSTWKYNPGTTVLSVKEWKSEEERMKDRREIYRNLKISVCLHPYQGTEYYQGRINPHIPWQRSLALVVQNIGRWALKNEIPVLIPRSIGWKCLKEVNWEDPESHPHVVKFKL